MKMDGKKFNSNNYGCFVITKYVNASEVHIEFCDTGYQTVVLMGNILKGEVRDKLVPSVHGVGILGDEITRINGKSVKDYRVWKTMLYRCYVEEYQQKNTTYVGCTVSENFKYFPYFKEWCNKQIGFKSLDDRGKSFALDKDILVKGNKQYNENTCCFVPQEINLLLVKGNSVRGKHPIGVSFNKRDCNFRAMLGRNGKLLHLGYFDTEKEAFLVYKAAKEAYIKEVANKWKGQIDPRVYEALMCYEVEIED